MSKDTIKMFIEGGNNYNLWYFVKHIRRWTGFSTEIKDRNYKREN